MYISKQIIHLPKICWFRYCCSTHTSCNLRFVSMALCKGRNATISMTFEPFNPHWSRCGTKVRPDRSSILPSGWWCSRHWRDGVIVVISKLLILDDRVWSPAWWWTDKKRWRWGHLKIWPLRTTTTLIICENSIIMKRFPWFVKQQKVTIMGIFYAINTNTEW